MGVDPQAVFHVCLSMALYICGNICGEYVLKVDMDLPVALQCNWAWPSDPEINASVSVFAFCDSCCSLELCSRVLENRRSQEILLALFISASTSFNSLEIENPFNGFNWLIWLMVSAMACHCIFSTYFTKICDGVAKVVAGTKTCFSFGFNSTLECDHLRNMVLFLLPFLLMLSSSFLSFFLLFFPPLQHENQLC